MERLALARNSGSTLGPATVRKVGRILWREYGRYTQRDRLRLRRDPLDSLIKTILTQNTNDRNSDRAFATLRKRFATWEEVMEAPVSKVADAIREGGLARIKAPRIQALLRSLWEARGELSLSFLDEMEEPQALAYLCRFHGVGAKTAACVLLFALGKPVFPVDTHVLRVAKRLGWVDAKATAERAQERLDAVVLDDDKLRLHVTMIQHGRRRCRPRQPKCVSCPVARYCQYVAGRTT